MYLDVLPEGAKCFLDGQRPLNRVAGMLQLLLTLACGDWVAGFLHLSFFLYKLPKGESSPDKGVSAGFPFMFAKLLEGFPGFPYSFARVSAGFLGVSVGFLRFRACVRWFW